MREAVFLREIGALVQKGCASLYLRGGAKLYGGLLNCFILISLCDVKYLGYTESTFKFERTALNLLPLSSVAMVKLLVLRSGVSRQIKRKYADQASRLFRIEWGLTSFRLGTPSVVGSVGEYMSILCMRCFTVCLCLLCVSFRVGAVSILLFGRPERYFF